MTDIVIAYWKRRAEESDEALERTRNDLGPTHMGEPVIAAPSPSAPAEAKEADGPWLCEKCQSRQRYFTRFCRNCNGDYSLSKDRPAPAEVVAWLNETWRSATESLPVVHDWEDNGSVVTPLVRLSDYEALREECEKLRRDAERYRWLRDSYGLYDLPYKDHGLGPEFPSGSELDAAIDAHRRQGGES